MNTSIASSNPSAGVDSQFSESQIASLRSKASGISGLGNPESVGEEFEAVFVSMMLKQMRSSMTEDGLFGGDSSDTYGGIFDMYLGKHIAASRPLGIGEMVKSYTESAVKS